MNSPSENHAHPDHMPVTVVVKRNKWTLGYLSVITTIGVVLQIVESIKGNG